MAGFNIIVPDELPPLGKLVNVTADEVTRECRLSYVFLDNATFDYKFIWQIEKTITSEKALDVDGTTWEEIVVIER